MSHHKKKARIFILCEAVGSSWFAYLHRKDDNTFRLTYSEEVADPEKWAREKIRKLFSDDEADSYMQQKGDFFRLADGGHDYIAIIRGQGRIPNLIAAEKKNDLFPFEVIARNMRIAIRGQEYEVGGLIHVSAHTYDVIQRIIEKYTPSEANTRASASAV